jgi:formiminotetrahydrofolate cyclodeaminase
MVIASSPPAELIGIGGRLLELAETLRPIVNPTVVGDVAAAVEAIRAAVATSRVNVSANLAGVTDQEARGRLSAVAAAVDELEERAARVTATVLAGFTG